MPSFIAESCDCSLCLSYCSETACFGAGLPFLARSKMAAAKPNPLTAHVGEHIDDHINHRALVAFCRQRTCQSRTEPGASPERHPSATLCRVTGAGGCV